MGNPRKLCEKFHEFYSSWSGGVETGRKKKNFQEGDGKHG
jgi:hypothetical protein